jgi:CheY-like chemotaxis protein
MMTEPPVSRRILVVDDNEDIALSFVRVLETMGHNAECVTDPLKAPAAARRLNAELVFLDIGMPVIDGYELARVLRAEFGFDNMRIVAVTAYTKHEDRVRAREAGFDAHVAKPAPAEVIESIVKTIFKPGSS